MKIKAEHWAFIALAVAGGLFFIHVWMSHGGITGVRQGLGLTREGMLCRRAEEDSSTVTRCQR